MNIWDYFLIRLKRQSKEKLIFYLRTSTEPLVKEYELGSPFFSPSIFLCCFSSFNHQHFALLSFTYFSSFFPSLVHFLCFSYIASWDIIFVICSFRHFFFFSSFTCFPIPHSLAISFTSCCFVVKFTLVYCSWQTWKERVSSIIGWNKSAQFWWTTNYMFADWSLALVALSRPQLCTYWRMKSGAQNIEHTIFLCRRARASIRSNHHIDNTFNRINIKKLIGT